MKQVYCTVADRRGRRLWDGLVPGTSDRDALGALLRGEGWMVGRTVQPDEVYRLSAGACSATAHGDELLLVEQAATLDEAAMMAERACVGAGASKHLYPSQLDEGEKDWLFWMSWDAEGNEASGETIEESQFNLDMARVLKGLAPLYRKRFIP